MANLNVTDLIAAVQKAGTYVNSNAKTLVKKTSGTFDQFTITLRFSYDSDYNKIVPMISTYGTDVVSSTNKLTT